MKNYEKPELEWMLIDTDIVTASGGDGYKDDSFDVDKPPVFN